MTFTSQQQVLRAGWRQSTPMLHSASHFPGPALPAAKLQPDETQGDMAPLEGFTARHLSARLLAWKLLVCCTDPCPHPQLPPQSRAFMATMALHRPRYRPESTCPSGSPLPTHVPWLCSHIRRGPPCGVGRVSPVPPPSVLCLVTPPPLPPSNH